MIVATLIAAVLLQKSEGGGLGVGGGGGGGFMSSRGTANLLTRTTGILAAGFFVTSMFLSWLAAYDRKPSSVINTDSAPISQPGGTTGAQDRPAARSAGPDGSAGATVAIKQGGHAGRGLPPCINRRHQEPVFTSNFKLNPMARYIFITGGVVSSLGKGLASAALGALLQARGYKVRLRKLDLSQMRRARFKGEWDDLV
eukprot:gene55071-75465_t